MSLDKNRQSYEPSQEKKLATLQGALIKDFRNVVDKYKSLAQIGDRFNTTFAQEQDEDRYAQEKVAQVLCTPGVLESGWDYYEGALRIAEGTYHINHTVNPIRKDLYKFLEGKPEHTQLDKFFEILDGFVTNNPIYEGKYEKKEFFWKLGELDKPLSKQDRKTLLDGTFEEPIDTEDIMMVAFLLYNDQKDMMSWSLNRSKQKEIHAKSYDTLTAHVQDYFNEYREQCLKGRFGESSEDIEKIFPEGSPLLSVALAVSFANKLDILPDIFQDLLRTNFVPGLSKESAQIVSRYYRERFDKNHSTILKMPDDNGYQVYDEVRTSQDNTTSYLLLGVLADSYEQTDANQTSATMEWFANEKRFDNLRQKIGDMVHTISMDNGIFVNVSSYSNKYIDMTVHDVDGTAFAVQIDNKGRIFGIPEDMEARALPYVASLFAQAKEEFFPKQEKNPQRRVISSKSTSPQEVSSQISIPGAMTREERITAYQKRQERVIKRKQLRAQEAEKIEVSEEPTTSRRVEKKQINISFTPTDVYNKQLAELAKTYPQITMQIEKALERIKEGHLKYMKPRSITRDRPVDENAYFIRIGGVGSKGARVKLIQGQSGEMVLASVQLRGIAYDRLDKDYNEVEKFLSRRDN